MSPALEFLGNSRDGMGWNQQYCRGAVATPVTEKWRPGLVIPEAAGGGPVSGRVSPTAQGSQGFPSESQGGPWGHPCRQWVARPG